MASTISRATDPASRSDSKGRDMRRDADIRRRVVEAGQGHVFRFMDEGALTDAEGWQLLDQLDSIDLAKFADLHKRVVLGHAADGESVAEAAPTAESMKPVPVDTLATTPASDIDAWNNEGLEACSRGEVALLVLSGGQGTRLGFDGPKGEYDIGLPSGATLFQMHAERLKRVQAMAAAHAGVASSTVRIPLYVMTSPMNDARVREYFAANDYFGLPSEDCVFFPQGTLPCMSVDGKLLLESKARVATSPDGNGGIYPALRDQGVLDDMERRGVKGFHVIAVDNAVVRCADPTFVGYCLQKDADIGSKVVAKASPHESVGVLCEVDGNYTVVEYSEIGKDVAEMRHAAEDCGPLAGQLVFNAGSICNHYYKVEFIRDIVLPSLGNNYHVAHKKIPVANDAGVPVKPSSNNGVKLEMFIFDVFPLARRTANMEVRRPDDFAPVKNGPGNPIDSPDSARAIVSSAHRSWLQKAGARVVGSGLVSIQPAVSYAGEGDMIRLLAGTVVNTPAIIQVADNATPVTAGKVGQRTLEVAEETVMGGDGNVLYVYNLV